MFVVPFLQFAHLPTYMLGFGNDQNNLEFQRGKRNPGTRGTAYRLARPRAAPTIGPFQLTKPNFPTYDFESNAPLESVLG